MFKLFGFKNPLQFFLLSLTKEKLDLKEFKMSDIQTCKYKAIMSSKNVKYDQITDVIQSGQLGTISQTTRDSFPLSGLISILANNVFVSKKSFLKASIKNLENLNPDDNRFGPSSGGSLIIVSSNVRFWGKLSVEGGDSREIYTGAGAGGNIYIYDPLWVNKYPERSMTSQENWDLRFSSGQRKKSGIDAHVEKYVSAENGSLFSSFCPSGSSSVFCYECPQGKFQFF